MSDEKKTFPLPYPAMELTPHEPPILMVETINSVDDDAESAVIGLTVRETNPFLEADGRLANEALIEIMAQAAAAQDGFNALRDGNPARREGFLVGVSKFSVERGVVLGDELEVSVELGPEFESLCVVFCGIRGKDGGIASAELTVWKGAGKPGSER
jgi:predicted hotdog family 3-hydroxylacyl-ACP dehydratase